MYHRLIAHRARSGSDAVCEDGRFGLPAASARGWINNAVCSLQSADQSFVMSYFDPDLEKAIASSYACITINDWQSVRVRHEWLVLEKTNDEGEMIVMGRLMVDDWRWTMNDERFLLSSSFLVTG